MTSQTDKSRISPLTAVLAGGLTAATLDILYAFIAFAAVATPVRILQSVASGLLGKASYRDGLASAALGAALHLSLIHI